MVKVYDETGKLKLPLEDGCIEGCHWWWYNSNNGDIPIDFSGWNYTHADECPVGKREDIASGRIISLDDIVRYHHVIDRVARFCKGVCRKYGIKVMGCEVCGEIIEKEFSNSVDIVLKLNKFPYFREGFIKDILQCDPEGTKIKGARIDFYVADEFIYYYIGLVTTEEDAKEIKNWKKLNYDRLVKREMESVR